MKPPGKTVSAVWVFLCLLFFAFGQLAIAQTRMYVSSPTAKLKADKTASSGTIEELPAGTAVTVVTLEGRWYRVSTRSGKKGWIYRGKLSKDAPEDEEGGDFMGEFSGSSIRADSSDTSRSIRGLSPETQAYAQRTGTPVIYRQSLEEVLSYRVSDRELDVFLRKGKIGEYAE